MISETFKHSYNLAGSCGELTQLKGDLWLDSRELFLATRTDGTRSKKRGGRGANGGWTIWRNGEYMELGPAKE